METKMTKTESNKLTIYSMTKTELKEREDRRLNDYSARLHYNILEVSQRAKLYKEEDSLDYVSDDIDELLEVYFSTTNDSLTLRKEIVEQKRLIRRLEKLIKADALISQALS